MDKKTIIFGAVGVLLVIGSSVGASVFTMNYLLEEQKKAEAAAAAAAAEAEESGIVVDDTRPPLYVIMEPFVINYFQGDSLRYLQLKVQLMTREEMSIEAVNEKMPEIRNALILMLSSQSHEALATREGKESMRDQIHEEVNNLLAADKAIESVFLTDFVMQ